MATILPDRHFKPSSENPRVHDVFPYGQQVQHLVGSDDANVVTARFELFKNLSSAELIFYRKVCREWRDHINQLFEQKVVNVFLFSSRYNLNQFLYFLKVAKLEYDQNYKLDDGTQPFPNFALFVSDIFDLASTGYGENKLFLRFNSTKRLIYYGEGELDGNRNPKSVDWHAHECLPPIAGFFKNLSSIVIHHFGYYAKYPALHEMPINFSRLNSIHLVQPSRRYVLDLVKEMDRSTKFITVRNGYIVLGDGNKDLEAIPYGSQEEPPAGELHTFFIEHMITTWGPDHHNKVSDDYFTSIPPEEYLKVDINFY